MNLKKTKKLKNLIETFKTLKHPFHVLKNSKLPFFLAFFIWLTALSFIIKLHGTETDLLVNSNLFLDNLFKPFYAVEGLVDYLSFNLLILLMLGCSLIIIISWGYCLISESKKGNHTWKVRLALKYGMLLFLVSEFMLFFPFFWAFFHGSLSPSIIFGAVWPPVGVEFLNPFMLPLVNTIVLLCSGVAVVNAHRAILTGYREMVINSMYIAISFGLLFSWLQFVEYGLTLYTINDGLFGSVFFLSTGLHGFHVIVGTSLLAFMYIRIINNEFLRSQHLGF